MKPRISVHALWILLPLLTGCVIDANPEPGPMGPPGNANVTSVNTTFSMRDAVQNGTVASVAFTVPAITQSVVDFGMVMVYFREQGTWTAMPYTFGVDRPSIGAVDYTITLGYAYERQYVEVFYEASNAGVALGQQPDREVKMVIIDGYATSYGKTSIDWSDYEAVARRFGLSD
jgi:hypothetical protein